MEQTQPNAIQPALNLHSLTPHNIFLILSFLDSDSKKAIIQADSNQTFKNSPLFSIARNQCFIDKYLNRMDRTIYMPFYSEPLFIKMEQQQLSHICTHSSTVLHFLADSFKVLISSLQSSLGDFQRKAEVVESIIESLTDPELPFAKLRKQNIGRHCNSAFQFFLVDKLFPSNQEEVLEENFEELDQYLSEKWYLGQQNQQKQMQIIEAVFYYWFNISYQNYQNYLLPKNTNHNLIVLIIALLDLLVDSMSFYIQSIQDSLYSFIEFNMRYCIYRNIILSLEEKLGFLFRNYSSFCIQIMEKRSQMKMQDQNQPLNVSRKMTIWHCGLSKWYIYMQRYHQMHFKNFFFLLKKLNLQVIKNQNLEKINEDKTFIQLQNRLEFNEIQLLERQEAFQIFSPIQDIFQERKQLYNQVTKEYVEYIVDISINQYSVHWCGHSSQALHIPFQSFESLVLENFRQYFTKIIGISMQVSNPIMAIDSIIISIIHQLDREYLKPVTLRKIAQFAQISVIQFIGEELYQKSQLFQTLKNLSFECEERDKMLNHFNEASNISNYGNEIYSIVIQSEDFNKALKTSASTTASRNSMNLPANLSLSSYDSLVESDFP